MLDSSNGQRRCEVFGPGGRAPPGTMLSAADRKALGLPSSDDEDVESGFGGIGSWMAMSPAAAGGEEGSLSSC